MPSEHAPLCKLKNLIAATRKNCDEERRRLIDLLAVLMARKWLRRRRTCVGSTQGPPTGLSLSPLR